MDWEFEISRCKLGHIRWINSNPCFMTQGAIFSAMINHNGEDYEKEYIHICISESLCCTAEINTNCKSTILQ